MFAMCRKSLLSLSMALAVVFPAWADDPGLALMQAVEIAQSIDPWTEGSRYNQEALEAEAISARTLPDPKVSLMLLNMPTDTFDFGQEAMTQVGVGVAQMFPRGDTLALTSEQKTQMALAQPFLRVDREAKVTATVSQLWLDAFNAQEAITLIENDRDLFEQLVDVALASYSTALGRTRQADVIRAQLELTTLDDRLTRLHQQLDAYRQRLSEWVGRVVIAKPLTTTLQELVLAKKETVMDPAPLSQQQMFELVQNHPALQALDQRIEATDTGVKLAKQKYKPEWGVNAQYGYRNDDPLGGSRSDLFTVGVTLDVPLFTANRQDQDVNAARARLNAIKTDKALLLRQLMAALETSKAELIRLDERSALYTELLLPQMTEQAGAAITAYNNDDGDFAEAVRARIAELNAKIEMLNITVGRQKQIAMLNYVLAESSSATVNESTALSGAKHE